MQTWIQRRLETAGVMFGKNSYNAHEADTMFAHHTADFDINYTIRGSYIYDVDGTRCVCPPGKMILIPPGRRYSEDADAYALQLGLSCKLLLAELLRTQPIHSQSAANAKTRSIPQDILDAANYVTAHLSSPLGAAELAKAANMNPAYFSRRFQEYIGMTPTRYITQIKMEYAQKRLITSDVPVKELAEELGFPDPFTFSKSFKKACGIAPSEYRRLNI